MPSLTVSRTLCRSRGARLRRSDGARKKGERECEREGDEGYQREGEREGRVRGAGDLPDGFQMRPQGDGRRRF